MSTLALWSSVLKSVGEESKFWTSFWNELVRSLTARRIFYLFKKYMKCTIPTINPSTKAAAAIGHLILASLTSIKNKRAVTELNTRQASKKLIRRLCLMEVRPEEKWLVSSIRPWSEERTVDLDRQVISFRALYSSAELCLSELLWCSKLKEILCSVGDSVLSSILG